MKSSGGSFSLGLWVFCGLVGLYLLGAAVIYVDEVVFGTNWIYQHAPGPLKMALEVLYAPLGEALRWLGWTIP